MKRFASMAAFVQWVRQPSTITGLGTLWGITVGAIAMAITGDQRTAAVGAATAFALTHLLIDDNTATQVRLLVTDALQAAAGGEAGLMAGAPTLLRDGMELAKAVANAPARGPGGGT